MARRRDSTPEEAMRDVTEDTILRAITQARKKGRTVFLGKTARGKGVDVATLDPRRPEGKKNLDVSPTPIHRHYTISGLGAPEETSAIPWRSLNMPVWRRILAGFQVAVSFFMQGTPLKNRLHSPYPVRVKAGSVVGFDPPSVRSPETTQPE